LRTPECYAAIGRVLGRAKRADFRVVHVSIQRNHLHFIIEAGDAEARTAGMRSLGGSLARAINRARGRTGKLFAYRYHATAIASPRQMFNTLDYVLNNWRKHREDRGSRAYLDRYSSAIAFDGWECSFATPASYAPLPVRPATTWLLRVGWRRHGTIDSRHHPRA
jgi:REP element-mobilizing transposase RayT